MKHITVLRVNPREGSLFSDGVGIDDDGDIIEFIDHTDTIKNINTDLIDYEIDNSLGRPKIYLNGWQYDKQEV